MKKTMDETSTKIFQAEIPFKDLEEEGKCYKMINGLSEKQLEKAACTSYAYLKASSSSTSLSPSLEIRQRMALRMARRHLVAENNNDEVALQNMIATLEFREEMEIDEFRQQFCDDKEILNDPVVKGVTVCGYDTDNRAILVRFPKYREYLTTEERYIKLLFYNLERAIACTERKSVGQQEKIVVVLNSKDAASSGGSSAPPLSLMKKIVYMVQNHYPERLHLFIPVEPPFLVRTLVKMVLAFVDPETKAKVKVISNNKEKESKLESIISEDQAMPFLRVNGKITSWDSEHYLRNLPFDRAANE